MVTNERAEQSAGDKAEDFLERRGIRQMSHSDDNILFQAIENGFKVDKYLK